MSTKWIILKIDGLKTPIWALVFKSNLRVLIFEVDVGKVGLVEDFATQKALIVTKMPQLARDWVMPSDNFVDFSDVWIKIQA